MDHDADARPERDQVDGSIIDVLAADEDLADDAGEWNRVIHPDEASGHFVL